jgi:hypothetical protein
VGTADVKARVGAAERRRQRRAVTSEVKKS